MTIELIVPRKDWTKQQVLQASEAPGRPWRRPAGGWISDLVALKKFITLCPYCDHGFNPRRHQYEVWRRDTYCVAKCDACGKFNPRCKAWIHESQHEAVGEWTRPRRRGRWAS